MTQNAPAPGNGPVPTACEKCNDKTSTGDKISYLVSIQIGP